MNKLVLITGATSGFGNGIVKRLLSQGYRVIATGRNLTARPEIFAQERTTFGGLLTEADLDVTNSEQRRKVVELASAMGGIDILINNAGFGLFGPLEEASDAKMRDQFEVNFFGPASLIRDFLPQLRTRQGLVVNISSVLGFVGFPLASLYCASKFAIEGLSESLAYELAPHGVDVILIQPGGFKTNFNDGTQWTFGDGTAIEPYAYQVANYQSIRELQSSGPLYQDPNEVINGLINILSTRNYKLRHTFGKDALLSRVSRGLLPREWFYRLAKLFFHQLLFKKLK